MAHRVPLDETLEIPSSYLVRQAKQGLEYVAIEGLDQSPGQDRALWRTDKTAFLGHASLRASSGTLKGFPMTFFDAETDLKPIIIIIIQD